MSWMQALEAGRARFDDAGFSAVDYLDICDAATLQMPTAHQKENLRVLAAVWLGKTRLIDNMPVG